MPGNPPSPPRTAPQPPVMGAKKKALKALRRKFSPPRHPKISQPLKRVIDEQDSGFRIQGSGGGPRGLRSVPTYHLRPNAILNPESRISTVPMFNSEIHVSASTAVSCA